MVFDTTTSGSIFFVENFAKSLEEVGGILEAEIRKAAI